jgi:hypothetical protein
MGKSAAEAEEGTATPSLLDATVLEKFVKEILFHRGT